MKKPLYLVIYPYKFTEHIYNYLELGAFKLHCNIEVWDLSAFLTPSFSNAYASDRLNVNDVIVIKTLNEFTQRLKQLNALIPETNLCVFNAIPFQSTRDLVSHFLIKRYLKKPNVAILKAYYSGIPTHFYKHGEGLASDLSLSARINRLFKTSTSINEITKRVGSLLFNKLAEFIPSTATHLLVAGEHYLQVAKSNKTVSQSAKFVNFHCQDFSNYLLRRELVPNQNNTVKDYAVLLDAPGPMFTSDYTLLKRKVFLTTEVWYPALTSFFDKLEADTGVSVKIAGHYKAKHPAIAPCFGNREVYYNQTKDLVLNAKFVITRSSAATSYAVMFHKPVIFIYSDQLKQDDLAMYDILGMAHMLGTKALNINEYPEKIDNFLEVNEKRYDEYKDACLTSAPASLRPNVQTILEDIMMINTNGAFN